MALHELVALRERWRERLAKIEAAVARLHEEAGTVREELTALDKTLEIVEREGLSDVEPGGPKLVDRIREIVKVIDPPFTTGAIRERLAQLDPDVWARSHRTSIAGTMRRMAEASELEVVERGGPGREASYRLPGLVLEEDPTAME